MQKDILAGVILIFIDVLNLAEQFGIYFIGKEDTLDETTQQRFFLILFGIGGATLFRPMFLWSKLKVIFSILIEIAEFIAYLILLPRTTNLIIVASVFFALEIILHLINLYATRSNLNDINLRECANAYCLFPIRVLFFGLIYLSPLLFLFLNPTSKFRDTYYEILLILNVFFGASYIDLTLAPCCTSKSESSNDEKIYVIWQYITLAIYNILAIIIMITTMVFAGQAIRRHATGEEILTQYDFGIYIYCLVNYGILAYGQLSNCCAMCAKLKKEQ